MKEHNFSLKPENLPMHELNGLKVRVSKSKDANKKSLQGRILRETKKTFEIETRTGVKKTAKRECEFEFEVQGKRVRIEGRLLEARPEDRIKIFAKKMRMV